MFEMWKKVFVAIAFTLLAVFGICGWVRYGVSIRHLEQSRHELESIRTELESAQDRERDIEASVERTGEILSESINTIQDLRNTLSVIRTEYEKMANLLRDSGRNSNNNDSDDNNTSDNTLTEDGQ